LYIREEQHLLLLARKYRAVSRSDASKKKEKMISDSLTSNPKSFKVPCYPKLHGRLRTLSSNQKGHASTECKSTTLSNIWKDKQASGRANNLLEETDNNPEETDNTQLGKSF
jgi:hypothetical protein